MTRRTLHLNWLASLFCIFLLPGANTTYAQTDSELVQMSRVGSYSFGGFQVSRSTHHWQFGAIAFDSTHIDTTGFRYNSSWDGNAVTYSYPHLACSVPIVGSTTGSDGFSLDIDTISHILLSVTVNYSYTSTMSSYMVGRARHATFDSVPYTITNKVLHVNLQAAPLRLREFSAEEEQSYSQAGVSGSIRTDYSLIKDSLFAPYLEFDLSGLAVKAVELEKPTSVMHIFPNPCNDEINVSVSSPSAGPIRIYDLLGQLLITIPVRSGTSAQIRIDAHSLPSGKYILATSNTSTLFSVVR
jgi:hypothetical protein